MQLQVPPVPTVKLFPRLAAARTVSTARITKDRAQVRARLLKMILDNERLRRQDHRPNAS